MSSGDIQSSGEGYAGTNTRQGDIEDSESSLTPLAVCASIQ